MKYARLRVSELYSSISCRLERVVLKRYGEIYRKIHKELWKLTLILGAARKNTGRPDKLGKIPLELIIKIAAEAEWRMIYEITSMDTKDGIPNLISLMFDEPGEKMLVWVEQDMKTTSFPTHGSPYMSKGFIIGTPVNMEAHYMIKNCMGEINNC